MPHVSGADIQGALERLGFQEVHKSGSHVVMKRDAQGCVVPMHSEVKVGTLAGLSDRLTFPLKNFCRRSASDANWLLK